MTKRILVVLLLLLLGVDTEVFAQTVSKTTETVKKVVTTTVVKAKEPQAKPAQVKTLIINVDHGTPLNLDAPAASVFIANPEIADVQVMSPTSIMIFGKRTGETTFMATDAMGKPLEQRTVVVAQDLTNLRLELNAAIPGNKIKVSSLPNGLVLTGEAKDPAAVADAYKMAQRYIPEGGDIINRIRVVGSNQIQIRVRFAEVNRSVDNSLGIDWQGVGTVGNLAFGIATGTIFPATGANIVQNATPANGGNRLTNSSLGTNNNIIGFSRSGSKFNLNGLMDALAQDGLVTILAEPTLTAMSGETANFLAGGEIPILIPQGGNSSSVTIQYKSFGISLQFTPTLISENRVNLHVKPEVSELTDNGSITVGGSTIQALKTRKAETTVELASGQSFAIAGLMDNSQAQTVTKYPFLGDIPILGALFRSTHFVNGQTELVVVITPYIVKPSGEQLALPTDGFTPPSETERLLGLRYSGSDPDARAMSGSPVATMVQQPIAVETPIDMPPTAASPVSDVTPMLVPEELPPAILKPVVAQPQPAVIKSAPPGIPVIAGEPKPAPALPPTTPVMPVAINPTAAAPKPLRPATTGPTQLVPAGPGGFILE